MEQHEKDVLEWSACVRQDYLVMCYLHDVKVSKTILLTVSQSISSFCCRVQSCVRFCRTQLSFLLR